MVPGLAACSSSPFFFSDFSSSCLPDLPAACAADFSAFFPAAAFAAEGEKETCAAFAEAGEFAAAPEAADDEEEDTASFTDGVLAAARIGAGDSLLGAIQDQTAPVTASAPNAAAASAAVAFGFLYLPAAAAIELRPASRPADVAYSCDGHAAFEAPTWLNEDCTGKPSASSCRCARVRSRIFSAPSAGPNRYTSCSRTCLSWRVPS